MLSDHVHVLQAELQDGVAGSRPVRPLHEFPGSVFLAVQHERSTHAPDDREYVPVGPDQLVARLGQAIRSRPAEV